MLYKYRTNISLDNPNCFTSNIFTENTLFYSSFQNFNDPFEGRIIVHGGEFERDEAIDRYFRVIRTQMRKSGSYDAVTPTWHRAREIVDSGVLEQFSEKGYLEYIRYHLEYFKRFGILSVSRKPLDILMWAHYANDHTGIVLGFDWNETGLPEAKEMVYQSHYRSLDLWSHSKDELADVAFYQKSSHWSYEQELRSIFKIDDEMFKEDNPPDILEARKRKFNPHSLKEVIFGYKLTKEAVIERIQFIKKLGYECKFYRATLHPTKYQLVKKELT